MSNREEAERIADELHCDWFDLDGGLGIIAKALDEAEQRGRCQTKNPIETLLGTNDEAMLVIRSTLWPRSESLERLRVYLKEKWKLES